MKKCNLCGDTQSKRYINNKKHGLLCMKCYQRERKNPTVYTKPNYGEIKLNEDGKPICHICGKAYNKLLTHVWQIHGLSAREYKKEFGLDVIKGIMSEESTKIASNKAYENYDLVVKKNLIENGMKTRFIKGHKGRTKNMVSEQTLKALRKRLKIINTQRSE